MPCISLCRVFSEPIKYQLPFNSDYWLLTQYVLSEDENEFIIIFRHHDYSHRMHSNFTFLWLHFLFSSEKSRFRLPTLRPSSIGLFCVQVFDKLGLSDQDRLCDMSWSKRLVGGLLEPTLRRSAVRPINVNPRLGRYRGLVVGCINRAEKLSY